MTLTFLYFIQLLLLLKCCTDKLITALPLFYFGPAWYNDASSSFTAPTEVFSPPLAGATSRSLRDTSCYIEDIPSIEGQDPPRYGVAFVLHGTLTNCGE